MKKYNSANSKGFLLGIIISILTFFVTVNATFAYFTAKATADSFNSTTALIRVSFSETTQMLNSTTISSNTFLLPSDTLKINTKVENVGNAPIYAILNLKLTITKTDSTVENIDRSYTVSGSTVTEILGSTNSYNNLAFELSANAKTSAFDVTYKFDGLKYDNSYKQATVHYVLTAKAIQKVNITNASVATDLLMDLA